MEFQSKFEESQKLKNCAEDDAEHIGEAFAPKGPWVVLIKEALNTWAAKQNPPVKQIPVTDFFGSETGDLVALYKRKQNPPILNFRGQIDRIVGKKTVVALDKELPPRRNPVIVFDPKVDLIVKFAGTLGAVRPLLDSEVFPEGMLDRYRSKPRRSLVRLGQTTTTIRFASINLIAQHVRLIKAALDGKILGSVFIYGSSSGGRNALDLATALTNEGIKIDYVGILDAAFFPNETRDSPKKGSFSDDPINIPTFNVPAINARVKENFFQTLGNHFGENRARLPDGLFGSSMGGKEIHGEIVGFTQKNLTENVKRTFPAASGNFTFDDVCHINLTKIGQPMLQDNIKLILENL